MYRIPFFIGTFISFFIPGRKRRRRVRGAINVFFFYIPIARFIRKTYGVRAKTIRFVRQVSVNRMTCVVNNRYYVKVFRDVSIERLNNFQFLMNLVRPHLSVNIPNVFVAKHIPMYVADKLPGVDLRDMDVAQILKHEKKIKSAVIKMIDDMQSIPVNKIPNNTRFVYGLQDKFPAHPRITKKSVLAHMDLNASNLLLDNKYNVISVIDWDSLQIVPDPNTDRDSFENLWTIYKNTHPIKK